jgi:hypothetical protein
MTPDWDRRLETTYFASSIEVSEAGLNIPFDYVGGRRISSERDSEGVLI